MVPTKIQSMSCHTSFLNIVETSLTGGKLNVYKFNIY